MAGGGQHIGQGEARVVGHEFGVDDCARQIVGPQHRLPHSQVGSRPLFVRRGLWHAAQPLVGPEAGAELGDLERTSGPDHHRRLHRQVWGDGVDRLALTGRLANQGEVALGKVSQPTMDQLGGAAGGARGKVLRLDQRHREAPHRRVPGHAGAGDAAADHDHVEGLPLQPGEERRPIAGVEKIHGRSLAGRAL